MAWRPASGKCGERMTMAQRENACAAALRRIAAKGAPWKGGENLLLFLISMYAARIVTPHRDAMYDGIAKKKSSCRKADDRSELLAETEALALRRS